MGKGKKWELTCPGVLTGVDPYVFEKSQPGDELWFFQGKFADGKRGMLWIYPVRDGRGFRIGMGSSGEEAACCFTASSHDGEGDLNNLLWTYQLIIGMVSGYATSVDFEPPELDPGYDGQAPGKRIAILRIGEMKVI